MDVWSLVSVLLGVLIASVLLLLIAIIAVGVVSAIGLAIVNTRETVKEQNTAAAPVDHPSRHLRPVK